MMVRPKCSVRWRVCVTTACLLILTLPPASPHTRQVSDFRRQLMSTIGKMKMHHHFFCIFKPRDIAMQPDVTLRKRTRSEVDSGEVDSSDTSDMMTSPGVPLPTDILISLHKQRRQQQQRQADARQLQELNKRLIDTNKLAIGLDLQTLSVRLPAYRRQLYQDQLREAKDRLHSLG